MNAVEIKNLNKNYKGFKLKNIDLSLPSGTIIGLIGENGAGKSTLIKSILGVIHSDYDYIKYFDKDLLDNEKSIKDNIAVIYDSSHYDPLMTPAFIGTMLSKIYSNWDDKLYQSYLERFSLPKKKKLKTFSRGMLMKFEFAIALSHSPKILILDEATSGLDPIARDDILNLVKEFCSDNDRTVLISSHITSDLDKIADYIAYIHEGKIKFFKPIDDIMDFYGIISVDDDMVKHLNKNDVEYIIREQYSNSVLIKNRHSFQKVFTDIEIKRPTVEEIMKFYVKGEK